jgi:hypothetical protein
MKISSPAAAFIHFVTALLCFLVSAFAAVGQEPEQVPQDPKPAISAPEPRQSAIQPAKLEPHRFWDRTNGWLFAGVGASRTLDYFSTLNMRRRGRQEIFLSNDAVDNHAAFAIIEGAATGVSIGASFLFHRAGHHKLERWTSLVHLSLATAGAARNYSLKTAHRQCTASVVP